MSNGRTHPNLPSTLFSFKRSLISIGGVVALTGVISLFIPFNGRGQGNSGAIPLAQNDVTARTTLPAWLHGRVEKIENDGSSPYKPADYFRSYDNHVSGAGAVVWYKYVPEISTLGIEFERYPNREQLPAILRSDDGKFSITLRTDASGALHLSALVEVEHAACNHKRCSESQTYCVTAPSMRCYCTYFGGVSDCFHQSCPSGGGGGVEPGSVDFTAVVPGGEW